MKEILAAHDYTLYRTVKSKIDPDPRAYIHEQYGWCCPRCKAENTPKLEWRMPVKCPECGLKVMETGNTLECET